jgi:hypothetical protein
VRRFGLIAVALATALALGACGSAANSQGSSPSSTPSVDDSYGALPTFLPSDASVPDSVLTGTVQHPALTVEGDAVRVQIPEGSLLVTVSGPEVPGEGLPYQGRTTTCTWTVTMSEATVEMPIAIGDFTGLDHFGTVYHPQLVPGQPKPPATIKPGQTVSFELRAVMAIGEGLMRLAPAGRPVVASWDFEVEND